MPYPIESRQVVNVAQVRSVEVGYRNNVKSKVLKESLMLTDDENIVDVQFAVQYVLKSPRDYLFENRSPDDSVLQAAESAIREVVGKSSMDYVVQQGRADVQAKVHVLMQKILDRYKTGLKSRNSICRTRNRRKKCRPRSKTPSKRARIASARKTKARPMPTTSCLKPRAWQQRLMQEAEGSSPARRAGGDG
jgi:membrane protease subunit HflK